MSTNLGTCREREIKKLKKFFTVWRVQRKFSRHQAKKATSIPQRNV
jgi:hypothetical protein